MADDLDFAAELEERERAAAVARHAARRPVLVPPCEHCEEHPVAVLPNGARGRYCARCAGELAA